MKNTFIFPSTGVASFTQATIKNPENNESWILDTGLQFVTTMDKEFWTLTPPDAGIKTRLKLQYVDVPYTEYVMLRRVLSFCAIVTNSTIKYVDWDGNVFIVKPTFDSLETTTVVDGCSAFYSFNLVLEIVA